MNPLPTLQALVHAALDWMRALPKLSPFGLASAALLVLISQLAVRAYEKLTLSMALSSLIAQLGRIGFLVIVCAAVMWALSLAYKRADQVFFISGAQQRWFASISQAVSGAVLVVAYTGGALALVWVAIVGGAHRLAQLLSLDAPTPADPTLLLHPASAPNSYLIIAGVLAVLLMPMFLRLQMLPTAAVIEEERATGTWSLLVSTTRAKTPPLLALLAVQAAVGAAALATVKAALAAVPASSLYFGQIPLTHVAVLVVVGGTWLSLLSCLQVAAVRHFIGHPKIGDEMEAQHFEVEDPEENKFVPPEHSDAIGEFETRRPEAEQQSSDDEDQKLDPLPEEAFASAEDGDAQEQGQ